MIYVYAYIGLIIIATALSVAIWQQTQQLTALETRQRLRELVASLDKFCEGGGINESSPAYMRTRLHLKVMIRAVSTMSMTRLIVGKLIHSSPAHLAVAAKSMAAAKDEIGRLTAYQKDVIRSIRRRADYWMVLHVFKHSMLLTVLVAIATVPGTLRRFLYFAFVGTQRRKVERISKLSVLPRGQFDFTDDPKLHEKYGCTDRHDRPNPQREACAVLHSNIVRPVKKTIQREIGERELLAA